MMNKLYIVAEQVKTKKSGEKRGKEMYIADHDKIRRDREDKRIGNHVENEVSS